MIRKLLSVFIVIFAATGFCDMANTPPTESVPSREEKPTMTGGYSAPARIDVQGKWDFFLSVSFLYWTAKEDGVSVANFRNNIPPMIISYTDMHFAYKPAFKVAFGMNAGNHDEWTIGGDYIRFHSTDHAKTSIPQIWNVVLRPTYISPNIHYQLTDGYSFLSCFGKWENKIDLIDMHVSRPFYLGKKLIFSPYLGLRGGWLDQSYFGNFTATNLHNTSLLFLLNSQSKQKTWLLGPRVGIVSDWLLRYGIRIFGDVFGSLCYQKFNNNYHDADDFGSFSFARRKTSAITPNLQVDLGLGYGTYLCKDKYHFDLTAGYDFQIFWNQNRMIDLIYDNTVIDRGSFIDIAKAKDLFLHGLEIAARLDF